MEILNLGNNSEDAPATKSARAKKIKVAKAAVGIGTLASLTGLGSTLAANISLNGGSNVEFGQGVAQTAACDEDGFTITPVSYYDSVTSQFRLDYVSVSGLNLTPMGTNYTSDPDASYMGIASAIAAHPGQYFDTDTNVWTNTCDQVVLDFKAYTDDVQYQTNTVDGFAALDNGDPLPNTVSSPLMWQVRDLYDEGFGGVVGSNSNNYPLAYNGDFAIIFDTTNDNQNYGTNGNFYNDAWYRFDWVKIGDLDVSNASFEFFTARGHHGTETGRHPWERRFWQDPAAGPISKITVESMKYFPSGYVNQDQDYDIEKKYSVWGDFGYYYLGTQYVPAP